VAIRVREHGSAGHAIGSHGRKIMLKRLAAHAWIAAAVLSTAVQAQAPESPSGYLSAGGEPVRTAFGQCWRTGDWTPAQASAQCDPLRRGHAREVLFGFDRAELDGEGRKRLDDLAQALLGSAFPRSVLIIGHADRLGSAAYNEQLSARRAQAVRDALIEKGVPARLLRVHSKGDSVPLTAGRCGAVGGAEAKQTLIACLQPDRRAEIELAAP
jgi:OmpA-OmpF porin, OOP family